jgi:hypothetical protein
MAKIALKAYSIVIFTMMMGLCFSCNTTKNVFDPNISAENSVALKIDRSVIVRSYNGFEVDLKKPPFKRGYTRFTIPVGDAVLMLDLQVDDGKNYITGKRIYINAYDIEFNAVFEKGQEYTIRSCLYTDEDGKVPDITETKGFRRILIICEGRYL